MEPSTILQRFMAASPIPVMVSAFLERMLSLEQLDARCERVSQKPYTRELLFSSVFELMSLVVFKPFPSVHAAYQAQKTHLGVSVAAVYDKLNGLEPEVPATLVRETARDFGRLIADLNGTYYLAGEIGRTHEGMAIAVAPQECISNHDAGALSGRLAPIGAQRPTRQIQKVSQSRKNKSPASHFLKKRNPCLYRQAFDKSEKLTLKGLVI